MIGQKIYTLLLLVFHCCYVGATSAFNQESQLDAHLRNPRSASRPVEGAHHHRRMVAVRSAAALQKRDIRGERLFKHRHALQFVDDTSSSPSTFARGQSPFSAKVHVKSSRPTLLLEDYDSWIDSITCEGMTISAKFVDEMAVQMAVQEVKSHPETQIITSHPGCNPADEFRPFLVRKTAHDDLTVTFTVVPTSWKKSFHSLEVHFGKDDGIIDHFTPLKRRQDSKATSTTATLSTSVHFPSAPTTSPTSTSIDNTPVDISFQDTAILPPNFPGVDGVTLHAPLLPHGMTIRCKNCSITGNIDLSHGMVGTSQSSSDSSGNSSTDILDFYENGYVEMVVNNFSAHIELESTVVASQDLISFTAPFPDFGIPGFVIPGIAEVGPVLRPRVTFGIQIATGLDFTYGMALRIPDNSTVRLNISEPTESSVTGFPNTTIDALPFQAQIDSLNLTASVAFNPQLLLTLSVFDDLGSINAGAFLDLPRISATVAQVKNVDEKCEPSSQNATTNNNDKHDDNALKDFFFNSLTNIVPSVELDTGVLAQAQLAIGPGGIEEEQIYTAFSTAFPLPTACISYDAQQKTYGPPLAAVTGKNGSGKNGNGNKNAAAALKTENPLGRLGGSSSGLALVLACVLGGMLVA